LSRAGRQRTTEAIPAWTKIQGQFHEAMGVAGFCLARTEFVHEQGSMKSPGGTGA